MSSVLEPTRRTSGTLRPVSHPEVSVVASSVSAGWDGVQALIVDGRLAEFYRHSSPLHVVAFLLNGTTRVEWKRGGRFTRSVSEPGALTIIPAGGDHQFRTDRPARALVWMIDPARLQSVAAREWGWSEPTVEVQAVCNGRDAEFWALGQRLAGRMLSPLPGSRLCAEALGIELALHLLWNYSSLPRGRARGCSAGDAPGDGQAGGPGRSAPRDDDRDDAPSALVEANHDRTIERPVMLAGHGLSP
jgi:hypothetical protein